jgi:outer membrane protein TolC
MKIQIDMKKKSVTFIVALICAASMSAQTDIRSILEQIEANNSTLAALKKQAEAAKIESRTGIYPSNPEVEFNRMWGSPAEMGKRTDLNIMQSFDFPTVYYYKRKIADGQATQADLQYAVERKSLLLEARKTCIELAYRNALKAEYDKRLQHAERVADAWQTKFDAGETGILERNKAQLDLLNARREAEQNAIEREALLAELTRLNGDNAIAPDAVAFEAVMLPANFEQWYAQAENANPALRQLAQEVEISRRREQLSKAQWLPRFSAGYVSERIAGTTLQGIGAGISIPLWENKKTVRAAKAQTAAVQSAETAAKTQFHSALKILFAKAQSLQRLSAGYRQSLQTVSNHELLQTALDGGQISLIEYIMEQTIYYEAISRALEAEKDLQQTVAELIQYNP